ncbi:hypothetical protein WL29_23085 [Burkholderia ubonensis]|uniref:Uncharacterized protein n=1 Tax=Burkholderia ubonensis TaxID=101571 RepID=A0A106QDE5_9BURK|nr:hypothetical protein WL29_23085 [Burkholderia ubonensis]
MNQYLSLADLDPFFKNAKKTDNITEAWRERYFKDLARIVHPPLVAFFKALKAEGRMLPIPNSDGYACRMWNTWNDAARLTSETPQAESDEKLEELARMFAHNLTFGIVYPYEKVLKKEGAEAAAAVDKRAAFDKIVNEFNLGTYETWVFSHENCWNTDLPLTLSFENWVPQGNYIERGKGSVPIQPLAPAQLQETVVEFKTGNLLVADWFRIEQFTTPTRREKTFSLNSRKGREEQTRYLAEQFGVVCVSVSNTSPSVFVEGNQVLVGNYYDDDGPFPDRFTWLGNVCTDLWAVTLVEYETLVDVVARTLPDTAKQVVDDYLAEQPRGTYGLLQLQLEPGTYYLYHFGDHEQFADMAQKAGINLDTGIVTPYFVLSKTRLLKEGAASA